MTLASSRSERIHAHGIGRTLTYRAVAFVCGPARQISGSLNFLKSNALEGARNAKSGVGARLAPYVLKRIGGEENMTELVSIFRALADASRLRIMNILSHQCMCVCDLQTVLGLSQSLISRHLAYLRHTGLVRDRRGGTWVCYSPAFDATYGPAVQSLMRQVLPLTPSLQADLEKLRQREKLGQLKHCAVPGEAEESVASRDINPSGDLQPSPGR